MVKRHTHWVCQNCGRTTARQMGRCPGCGEWDTMVEIVDQPSGPAAARPRAPVTLPRRLSEIGAEGLERIPLPIKEFSRVLGGGIVPGSLILVAGDPGIGKSTLLLQTAAILGQTSGQPVLYVSGEESARQVKMRAGRLGISTENLFIVTETNLEEILRHADQLHPLVVVVDSVQTVYSEELTAAAGSISQVRQTAARFQWWAKAEGIAVFVLEHIVDTVLYLEGDRFHIYRLLRAEKNRFGATSEVGVFEMRGEGMVEVSNPSEVFLAERMVNAPGSSIAVTSEGTRSLLVEVQALASPTSFGNPRRTANGIDFNRLLLICAVLTRRAGLRLYDQDVFTNVVGGLQINEPAADLAVAVAIASSMRDQPIAADIAVIGEIGLSGEVRSVGHMTGRLNEAVRLGFRRCVVPRTMRRGTDAPIPAIDLMPVRSVAEALAVCLI